MSITEKLVEIAENQQKVYDAGYAAGQGAGGNASGYDEGYAKGKQEEYDAFWDNYQDYGNRTDYNMAFGSHAWNDNIFKPKYDIKPISATRLFGSTDITDIKGCLERAGVVLDLSNCTSMVYLMETGAKVTRLPILNVAKISSLNYFMNYATNLISVDKVILKSDGSQTFSNTSFGYLSSLVEIRFEGVIGKTINFQWSPLSRASIESIVEHLSDSVSGQTASFKKTAVLAAFGTEADWTAYIASKPNWSFTLV